MDGKMFHLSSTCKKSCSNISNVNVLPHLYSKWKNHFSYHVKVVRHGGTNSMSPLQTIKYMTTLHPLTEIWFDVWLQSLQHLSWLLALCEQLIVWVLHWLIWWLYSWRSSFQVSWPEAIFWCRLLIRLLLQLKCWFVWMIPLMHWPLPFVELSYRPQQHQQQELQAHLSLFVKVSNFPFPELVQLPQADSLVLVLFDN